MVAIGGQRCLMFCNAVWQLRGLKVFVASTSRVASYQSQTLDMLHELQPQCHKSNHHTFAGSLLHPGYLVI